MRKILMVLAMAVVAFMAVNCSKRKEGACVIKGVMENNSWDGKQIFLVPMSNDNSSNVDSVYIEDGKFEFVSDTVMLAKILLDYRVRYGTQVLLVMVEPGTLEVKIGAKSSAHGTPLNDTLQQWKEVTEVHNSEMGALQKLGNEASRKKDMADSARIMAQADSVHLAYKQYTRRLATHLPEGELKTFLGSLFPLKYKQRRPDGKMVWMDADTKEELGIVEE